MATRTVKRGEIWTVAGGPDYTGKPRPAVILQADHFDTDSVTVCPFTTNRTQAPLLRLDIDPTPADGLDHPSSIVVDKITTMPRSKLGERIGDVPDTHMLALSRALLVFLGIAT